MQCTLKKIIQISFLQFLCFLIIVGSASAQKYVQLEIFNSANVKKYAPGDRIVFKSKEFPKNWQKQTIIKIDYEAELIHFKRGYIEIKDITQVRVFLPVPYALAKMLYLFGTVSLIYGGIGDAIQGELQQQTVIFSVGPIALAFFLDKAVSYKKYTMGKTARLRVLDLNMY